MGRRTGVGRHSPKQAPVCPPTSYPLRWGRPAGGASHSMPWGGVSRAGCLRVLRAPQFLPSVLLWGPQGLRPGVCMLGGPGSGNSSLAWVSGAAPAPLFLQAPPWVTASAPSSGFLSSWPEGPLLGLGSAEAPAPLLPAGCPTEDPHVAALPAASATETTRRPRAPAHVGASPCPRPEAPHPPPARSAGPCRPVWRPALPSG